MQTSANNKSTCACSSLPPKMTKIPQNIGAHVLIESARCFSARACLCVGFLPAPQFLQHQKHLCRLILLSVSLTRARKLIWSQANANETLPVMYSCTYRVLWGARLNSGFMMKVADRSFKTTLISGRSIEMMRSFRTRDHILRGGLASSANKILRQHSSRTFDWNRFL